MQKKGKLFILCGLPYSGKTTLQKALVKRLSVQVVSMDQIMDEHEMWREGHPTQADWDAAYSEAYRQMQAYLKARETVLFDCANLPFHEREHARSIADSLGVPHQLIYVNTSREEILRRRQDNERTKERGHLDEEDMELAFNLFDEPTAREHPILYNHQMDLDEWIAHFFHSSCRRS